MSRFLEDLYCKDHQDRMLLVDAIYEQIVAAELPCYPPEAGYQYRHWEDVVVDDPWEGPIGMNYRFHFQPNEFYVSCGFTFNGISDYQQRKDVLILLFYENPQIFRVSLLPDYIPRAQQRYEVTFDAATQAMLKYWGFRFDRYRTWVKLFTVSPDAENQPVINQIVEDIGNLRSIRGQMVFHPLLPLNRSLRPPKTEPKDSPPQTTPPTVSPPIQPLPEPEQVLLLRELENLDTGHQRRRIIGEQLAEMGDPRPGVELGANGVPQIEWCYVDGGDVDIREWPFRVQPFYISKYLITYGQFQAFLDAPDGFAAQEENLHQMIEEDKEKSALEAKYGGTEIQRQMAEDHRLLRVMSIRDQAYRAQKVAEPPYRVANYPRVQVSAYQAAAFAGWLSMKLRDQGWPPWPQEKPRQPGTTRGIQGRQKTPYLGIRLPTEWEWQLAATSGDPARVYPWGADTDYRRLNSAEAGMGQPISVGLYPTGAASCGALDMAGNVREWCINDFDRLIIDPLNGQPRTTRGGSWHDDEQQTRCTNRHRVNADYKLPYVGFRVVLGLPV